MREKQESSEELIDNINYLPNKLTDYIAVNYNGSQAAFARAQSVKPQQVTEWINKKFIVVDHVLYSPRRELNN